MDQDQDLFFLDRAVEVDMSNTDTSNKQKNQADLTSTGLISTFRLTVMATTQKTPKCKQHQTPNSKTKTKPNIGYSIRNDRNHTFGERHRHSLNAYYWQCKPKIYSTPKRQQPAARRLGPTNETQGPPTTRPESEYGTPRRLQR